ncbi:hypothetical protein L7F22_043452 [Adiantum nelumboides]|nr:hypothetical protein [Adiantum nelumboides]
MASRKDQLTPSASGDAGRDHNEDSGREYGPPRPTQTEQREMKRRQLIGDATKMMLSFAKDPNSAKYMTETSFQDVHTQCKKATTPPPKPAFKKSSDHKQYSEKELEEAAPTLAAAYSISKVVQIPVLCASGLSDVTAPLALAAGAAVVGVGSAINKLDNEVAMIASVRSIADALGLAFQASVQRADPIGFSRIRVTAYNLSSGRFTTAKLSPC